LSINRKQSDGFGKLHWNVQTLKSYLEENMNLKKNVPEIPETGIAVLEQQYILTQAIETWIASMKKRFKL